jgi:outer membrane protein OmpA-like peptidoglycan-associated protein
MSTTMRTSSLIVFTLAASTFAAQSRHLKKADRYYRAHCYSQAIPHYKKGMAKDSAQTETLGKLGDCYRLTNDTRGELNAYGKLVKSGKATPVQQLYYAEALTADGKFNEATPYFEKYTADARGRNKASAAGHIPAFSKNANAYRVKMATFNSQASDFGAVTHSDRVFLLSSRSRSKWINHRHGWTMQSPVHLYSRTRGDSALKWHPVSRGYRMNEGPLSFSAENEAFLCRNEKPASKKDDRKLRLYSAKYDKEKFTDLKKLPFCSGNFNYAHPAVSSDGNTLYFASDMDGGYGGMDIYAVSKTKDGWSQPVNMGEKLNTAGNELFPFIASDGKLYFSSDGHEGLGGLDIYEARMKEGKASRVYNMGVPVNSREDDFSFFLEKDNKSGFLSSNRNRGGLDDDIFHLEVLREVKRGREVLIVAKDKSSGQVIPNMRLRFGKDSALTNEKGEFATMVDEDQVLRLSTFHPDYFSANDSIVASASDEEKITRTVNIEKDPKLALVVVVKDLKTGQPLPDVKVTVRELPSRALTDEYKTDGNPHRKPLPGKKIGDKISYEFRLEKEGYVTKKAVFIHDVTRPGDIVVHEVLDLSLGRIEVGADVGKMIDLKPIYFDLGKSTIRKDAAVELDKIVEIMKEYPNMSIELGSHTDCRSGAASNMKLSTARAKSSASYIVKKGIDKNRITGKGYGESKLLNGCICEGKKKSDCPEEEHAKNRRTEFIITRLK